MLDYVGHRGDETDSYPYLRKVLAPEYANLSSSELEYLVTEQFPGASAAELDESIGNVFKKVGSTLSKAAPGMLQGAMSGAAAGSALGPYGMLAGALGGAALGGYQSHQAASQQQQRAPALRTAPAVAATRPAPGNTGIPPSVSVSQPVPPVVPRAVTTAPNAAASTQLLAMLSRPETLQALLSMVMGQIGRRDVQVGKTQVPVAAFANSISTLGQRSAEWQNHIIAGEAVDTPAYLLNSAGEFVCDPMDNEQRTSVLMSLLANEASKEDLHRKEFLREYYEDDFDEIDELDELLDQAEEDEAWEEELEELLG